MLTTALLLLLSATAVAAGGLVFRVDSMARATFLLLLSFLAVAGLVLMTGLHYLGLVIVLMMDIEMVVVAIFTIMYMMNRPGSCQCECFTTPAGPQSSRQRCSARDFLSDPHPEQVFLVETEPALTRAGAGAS